VGPDLDEKFQLALRLSFPFAVVIDAGGKVVVARAERVFWRPTRLRKQQQQIAT